MKVQAHKVVTERTGYDSEVPMNDWLEVGIFEEGKGLDKPLYLQMIDLKPGDNIKQLNDEEG